MEESKEAFKISATQQCGKILLYPQRLFVSSYRLLVIVHLAVNVTQLAMTGSVFRIQIKRSVQLCYRPAIALLSGVDYRQILVRVGEARIQSNRPLIFIDCEDQ